jgi:hypothetical protein
MKRAMLLVLVILPLVGCDEGRVLQPLQSTADGAAPEDPAVPEVPVEPDAGAPDADPGLDLAAPADAPAMCRHYCQTLEQTLLYSCLQSDGPAGGCAARFEGTTQRCLDLRCAPRLVSSELCLTQCDALARFYGPACARPDLTGTQLCALPAGERDRLCREGCADGAGAP